MMINWVDIVILLCLMWGAGRFDFPKSTKPQPPKPRYPLVRETKRRFDLRTALAKW